MTSIFAAKASETKPEYMKKLLLPITIIACALGAHAQVHNGNFDHWQQMDLFDHPVMGVAVSSSNIETFFEAGITNVNAVDGPTGAALRLESIAHEGQVFPGFFLTGSVPNGEGEEIVFEGGVPVNDANVTGVKLDLRHHIVADQEGLLIVQFKKNGQPIGEGNMGPGTMVLMLEGEADWHQKVVEFEGGFGTAPDACVVGVTTANLLSDDGNFPAGSWVEIDNIEFLNGQPLPGGDFETWAAEDPIFTPEDVLVDVNPFNANYERTVDAVNGMFAIKLFTTTYGDGGFNAGRAVFGAGDLWNPTPTVAIHSNDTELSFAYKYAPEGNDVASAQVAFFVQDADVWNQVHFKEIDLEATEDFTYKQYAFKEELDNMNVVATHMVITFASSKWNEVSTAAAGSTLIVDDVALDGTLRTGVANLVTPRVVASPNPAVFRVTFDFNMPRSGYYRVLDSKGKQVAIREFQSAWSVNHDLQNLRSGMYLFRFVHNGGVDVVRVMKL